MSKRQYVTDLQTRIAPELLDHYDRMVRICPHLVGVGFEEWIKLITRVEDGRVKAFRTLGASEFEIKRLEDYIDKYAGFDLAFTVGPTQYRLINRARGLAFVYRQAGRAL
jgi:hypothetical protein